METFAALIVAALILASAPIIGVLFGACVGWLVGLFFADTILGIADQLGVHHITMWQLGATLGFVTGFFRSNITTKS